MHLVSSSDGHRPLFSLREGKHGVVVEVRAPEPGRADRLLPLCVTPGARVTMVRTFPGVVFLCDQTKLAVEGPRRRRDSRRAAVESIMRQEAAIGVG